MMDWAAVALAIGGLALMFFAGSHLNRAGAMVALGAAAFGLGRILGWQSALAWLLGPATAILLLSSTRQESGTTFEKLAMKGFSLAAAFVVSVFAASHTDITDQTWLTILPVWLLAGGGLALLLLELQDQPADFVLLGAGGSGLLLAATSLTSALLALACGLCLLVTAVIRRYRPPLRLDLEAAVLVGATLLFGLLAIWPHLPSGLELAGIPLSLGGIGLAFIALLALLGSAQDDAGPIWSLPLGAVAVIANGLPLRWAALFAIGGIASVARRPILAAIAALGLASLTQLGLAQPSQGRITAVVLALAVLFSLMAIRLSAQPMLTTALTGYLVLFLAGLPASITTRIEVLALSAIGLAVLLEVHRGILTRSNLPIDRVLTFGLLFLAVFARDSTGIGLVAAVLLLIALGLKDQPLEAEPTSAHKPSLLSLVRTNLLRLARSLSPPAAAFVGGVLAVIAAFGVSWSYGLIAIALYAGLLVFRQTIPAGSRKSSRWSIALAAISLVLGFAPGLLFRLLHL